MTQHVKKLEYMHEAYQDPSAGPWVATDDQVPLLKSWFEVYGLQPVDLNFFMDIWNQMWDRYGLTVPMYTVEVL